MKAFISVVVLSILGVALYTALEQHQANERVRRAETKETLQQCWTQARHNGGLGVEVCKDLANTLK